MDAQTRKVLALLSDAKTAHQAGDFAGALRFYETFFDQSRDENPEAMYSLRLYMCLDGWAALAKEFPGAKNCLQDKQVESLSEYQRHKDPERFHDFLQICLRLNAEQEAVDQFLLLHKQQPKSSAKLSKFIWDSLLKSNEWQACNDLLPEPSMKMDELFAIFDEASKLKEVNPMFDNAGFTQHTIDTLFSNLDALVNILRHANRQDEISKLQRQFISGIEQRNNSALHLRFNSEGSFLFTMQ